MNQRAIGLRDLQVRYRDYDPDNPPLLHQKHQTPPPTTLATPSFSNSASRKNAGAYSKTWPPSLTDAAGNTIPSATAPSYGGTAWSGKNKNPKARVTGRPNRELRGQ